MLRRVGLIDVAGVGALDGLIPLHDDLHGLLVILNLLHGDGGALLTRTEELRECVLLAEMLLRAHDASLPERVLAHGAERAANAKADACKHHYL